MTKEKAAIFAVALAGIITHAAPSQSQITGRPVPAPIYGVTFDDVSKASAEVKALGSIAKVPTVRVVFDKGESPAYYKGPIQQFRQAAYVMGELVDSSYMRKFQTVSAAQSWANNYVTTLGALVDVWEIGNEINGDWLGSNAFGKMAAMYDVVAGKGGRTALTFFYEGESNDPNNCIDSQGGMFPWIAKHFTDNPTAESEQIRLGLSYVLISWYPDQCRGENPNWPQVYTKLSEIFPNSKVGFGELGTANHQGGSAYEKNEILAYYPMGNHVAGLPSSYIGGYFWWYGAEEIVPWPGAVGNTLNQALSSGP